MLALALFVATIDAHHHHHRCGCDDDRKPCKCPTNKKPYETTSQNTETEAPTSNSTTTAFSKASTGCVFQKTVCRKGVCPQKDLGIFCCCGKNPKIAKPLENPKSKCHIEYNDAECDAINVTCSGCDDRNNCKCKYVDDPSELAK